MTFPIALKDLGLAFCSGTLLFLSFPRFDLSFLVWIGLVPLLLALEGKALKQAFLLSFVTVMVFLTTSFYWIWVIGSFNLLDYLVLGGYVFSVYGGGFGLALNWLRRNTGQPLSLIAPPIWVSLEYLRAHAGFLSGPWMLLGHTQYQQTTLIQFASLTGVYGLTFLIVFVNATVAESLLAVCQRRTASSDISVARRFPPISLGIAALLLLGTLLYGSLLLSKGFGGPHLSIALTQTTVPRGQKWDKAYKDAILQQLVELTHAAAEQSPHVIIWPETAVPGDLRDDPALEGMLAQLAVQANAYLLAGASENGKFSNGQVRLAKYYNSMYLIAPTGKIEARYDKIRLVPFGEYEPLRGYLKWPKALVDTSDHTLNGHEFTVLKAGHASFGAVICWESSFPELFREFVKRGARLMINATNESWFVGTTAPDHFLIATLFRAVENRVTTARATNLGISAIIDPFGRIVQRTTGSDIPRVLAGTIVLSEGGTFYTLYGDVFALSQLGLCVLMLLYGWLEGSRLMWSPVFQPANILNRTRLRLIGRAALSRSQDE